MKTTFLYFLFISVIVSSCSQIPPEEEFTLKAREKSGKANQPDNITFTAEGLYPEGVGYHKKENRFLVSSLRFGTIGEVNDKGRYQSFAEDEQLVSTAGLFVDEIRNRIIVCNLDLGVGIRTSPETQGKLAGIGIYDLSTGSRLNYVDLGSLRPDAGHAANDLTIDSQGNIYITDSFSPVIYKVDKKGIATVFIEDKRFAPTAPGGFGLNGIVYHPQGYLIAAKYDEGILFKIPLRDPEKLHVTEINRTLAGADGLLLKKDGSLLVVLNPGVPSDNKVISLESSDQWISATAKKEFAPGNVSPTTLASRGGYDYVLHSHLFKLFGGQNPPVSQFTIEKVKLGQ